MITPDFKLGQTSEHLLVRIRLPYVKISKADFYNDEHVFKFYLKPYFLSLTFDEPLVPDRILSPVYNHDSYLLEMKIEKKNKGETFANLQMINQLMRHPKPKEYKKKTGAPLIQVLESKASEESEEKKEESESLGFSQGNQFGYGFLQQSCDFFGRYEPELYSLSQINPDEVPFSQRQFLRAKSEQENFNPEHFLADTCDEDGTIAVIFKKEEAFPWTGQLSEEEAKDLKDLGGKEALYSEPDVPRAMIQLNDILFAFLYEAMYTSLHFPSFNSSMHVFPFEAVFLRGF